MKLKIAHGLLVAACAMPFAMFQPCRPAFADPPIWANAKWVKATATNCGGTIYLTLRGNSVQVPKQPSSSGCTNSEEIYHQLNISKTFLRSENKGLISESHVDAGYIFCGKGEAAINIGPAREVERAIRDHPAPPGCTYTIRSFQYISSVGSIPFTNVANGGTMTIAESLALGEKERARAIAECNASAACRAQVSRMSANSAMGPSSNPCQSGYYSRYSPGTGRCTDSNGNADPSGSAVFQH